ncbi:hypothetical protein ACFOY2_43180 [Nonomuraea purpurea]|uniref:Integral membrane protein n=1 Tax=Nonomuraea purpurea TaxID=1849276 RepID=A0ABV8GMH7_9ACTN
MRGRPMAVLLPAGFVLGVGSCVVATVLSGVAARLAVVAVAAGLYGAWARRWSAALATAVLAWCFATGFLVRGRGELTFTPDDLATMGEFVLTALAGCACAAVHAAVLRARRRRAMRARARPGPVQVARHGERLRRGAAPPR